MDFLVSYTEILATARAHDSTIAKRMRGWAVEVHHDKPVLISYWFNKNKDVSAQAIFIDDSGEAQLDMIAAHLNERVGAGPLLIQSLQKLHGGTAKNVGTQKTVAEVVRFASKSIN